LDPSQTNLLDPTTISQAEALGMMARHIVEGPSTGENRSPFHGFSVEFAQHRQYSPGDDIRHLDWKILGKSDKYFVKRYQQETSYLCQILLDTSESMAFGEGDSNKLLYAKRLAACLAYAVLKQRDSISLRCFDHRVAAHVPRTSNMGSMFSLLTTLAGAQAVGKTSVPAILHRIAGETTRRGIIVLISDLLDDEDAIIAGIKHLAFAGQEVIVFHTMHDTELNFDLPGAVRFEGLESGDQLTTSPRDIRDSYLQELRAFQTKIRVGCEQSNCHYVLHNTAKPLHEAVAQYLAFRQQS
jgi:uncharacterized protein (DUF58 family)